MKIVLTIAGSDSSGGAGIQADLKTFEAFGVFGTSVITVLTAQNTKGVTDIYPIEPSFIKKQLETIFDDFDIALLDGNYSNNLKIYKFKHILPVEPDESGKFQQKYYGLETI